MANCRTFNAQTFFHEKVFTRGRRRSADDGRRNGNDAYQQQTGSKKRSEGKESRKEKNVSAHVLL